MTERALVEAIAHHCEGSVDYARRLVADLTDAEMVSQPVGGRTMNHAAWVLAHLGVYGPILEATLRGRPFADPLDHRFGGKSKPVNDSREYPAKDELVRTFADGYAAAIGALRAAPTSTLSGPPPLERWRARFPTVADLSVHMMLTHMSVHLGQLSAWRRAGGRPAV